MPQPYDYSMPVKDAFASSMAGFREGLQLSAYRQKMQEYQTALDRQHAADAAFAQVHDNPTPANIIAFKSRFPEAVAAYKPAMDAMDADRKDSAIQQALPVYTALQSGDTESAKALLDTNIEAFRNSGMDTKHLEMIRSMIDASPNSAAYMIGATLESAMGTDAFGKHGEEMRKQGMAQSEQTKAEVEARYAEPKVQAQIAKAKAEAKKAGQSDFKTIDAGGEILTGYSDAGGNFVKTGTIKKSKTPQTQAMYGDSGEGDVTLSEGDMAIAKQIVDYKKAPFGQFALRNPRNRRIAEWIAQNHPEYDETGYAAKVKARRDFATGQEGRMYRSIGTATKHLDMLSTLGEALDNGNVQALNAIGNAFKTQFGNNAKTNFDAAKQIVGQEVVKAIVIGGGGVTEREEAAKSIRDANSPQQLQGVIDTYRSIMGAQKESLQQQAAALGIPDSELPDYTEGAGPASLTAEDKQALAWARANSGDPRANQILQRLGRQ